MLSLVVHLAEWRMTERGEEDQVALWRSRVSRQQSQGLYVEETNLMETLDSVPTCQAILIYPRYRNVELVL